MSSGQGTLEHVGQAVKLEDTFTLLDSRDLSVVDGIKRLILEQLSSGKEPWLVTAMVDHYYATGSPTARGILADIREPLDKVLMDKIQDGLRSQDTKILAMQLLLYIVDRQPPWTHRLVERPIFTSLIKYLRIEADIPMLMSGVMVLVILLPVVPVSIGAHLQEVLDIFARIAGLMVKKPVNAPEVFMLHLHVAVYVLFLRLYGMFPCTFFNFLRAHFTTKENYQVYQEVIAPMMEKVRFNPLLVSNFNDVETSKSKWRTMEPQDIVVSCAKMSLDPIEGTIEELRCPIIPQPPPEIITTMKLPSKSQKPQDESWQEKMERVSEMFPIVIDPACYGFSPSQVLSLSTPPTSQRATPATSFMDLTTSLQQSTGGTVSASPQLATPVPEATVKEMPVGANETPASMKVTPIPPRTGPKNTPVQLNRTQGSSAFTSPHDTRPSSTTFKGPSPLKFMTPYESPAPQSHFDAGAARVLSFDRSLEVKSEGMPKHIGMLVEKDGSGAAAACRVPVDSLPSIIRTLSTQDNDPLDQEVSQITEVEDHLAPSSYTQDTAPGASTEKSDTPESVKRFMKKVNRIRFNSLTSHLSEPAMYGSERSGYAGRARSCPPLRRKPLPSQRSADAQLNSPRSAANSSRLDTVSESAVVMHSRNDAACGGEASFFSQELQGRLCGSKDGSEASSSMQTKVCGCQCGGTSLHYMVNLANIFRSLLVPVKLAVCRQCQQILVSDCGDGSGQGSDHQQPPEGAKSENRWTAWPVASKPYSSALSPAELLDRHLTQGKDQHTKELSHIPLTSNQSISWTHFGGGPPADEVNILRGQKLMLQNQLMYERHKRSNHAMRNRRLLRRIAHVSALEEQVQTMTYQLEEKENYIKNLQVSLKLLQDNNHQLMQTRDSDEYEKLVDFKTTIQQNKDLQEANVELKNLLLSQKAENDDLKKELQSARAQCFELQKENEMLYTEMESVDKWKSQVVQLQKELLLMGEAHERLQNQIQQQQRLGQENLRLASEMDVLSLKAEVKKLKNERAQNTSTLEAASLRLGESDDSSKAKDLAIKEIKSSFEAAKSMFSEQIKAVEDKYQAMVRLNLQMEGEVLTLNADKGCLLQKIDSLQSQLRRYQGPPTLSDPHNHSPSPPGEGSLGGERKEKSRGRDVSKDRQKGKSKETRKKDSTDRSKERKDGGAGQLKGDNCKAGREGSTAVVLGSYSDDRKASQRSRDSGHGSLTASGQTMTSDSGLLNGDGFKPILSHQDSLRKRGGGKGDKTADASSAILDVDESGTVLYTDSEDGSQSSFSNFTVDSGIDNKLSKATN